MHTEDDDEGEEACVYGYVYVSSLPFRAGEYCITSALTISIQRCQQCASAPIPNVD